MNPTPVDLVAVFILADEEGTLNGIIVPLIKWSELARRMLPQHPVTQVYQQGEICELRKSAFKNLFNFNFYVCYSKTVTAIMSSSLQLSVSGWFLHLKFDLLK